MLFQQQGLPGTATQSFQRNRSSAGKQVQDLSLLDSWPDQVENGFSNAVFHGTRACITTVLDRLAA